jgi:hypothetical protein
MTDIDPTPDDSAVDVELDPNENINDQNPEDAGPDVDYYNTEVTSDDPVPEHAQAKLRLFAVSARTYPILEQIIKYFPDHSHLYVTSVTGGKHAPDSYHYRAEAIDVGSGSQIYKDRLAAWLYPHYANITELIHSKAGDQTGWYVKKGKRVGHGYYGKTTTRAHVNHVHFAIASVAQANAVLAAVQGAGKPHTGGKPDFPGVLRRGNGGNAVRTLQGRLNTRGYRPILAVDGHFGEETEKRVKAFQGFAKLPKNGIVDKRTFDALWDLKIT